MNYSERVVSDAHADDLFIGADYRDELRGNWKDIAEGMFATLIVGLCCVLGWSIWG